MTTPQAQPSRFGWLLRIDPFLNYPANSSDNS